MSRGSLAMPVWVWGDTLKHGDHGTNVAMEHDPAHGRVSPDTTHGIGSNTRLPEEYAKTGLKTASCPKDKVANVEEKTWAL